MNDEVSVKENESSIQIILNGSALMTSISRSSLIETAPLA